MKYFPFLILLFISFPLFAQLGSNPSENEQNLRSLANLNPLAPGARAFDNRYEGVRGTPLLLPEMAPLEVGPADRDDIITGLNGNIDLEKALLYVRFKDGATGSIPAASIRSVTITGPSGKRLFRVFPILEVEGQNDEGVRFYEVLHDGAFTFLKLTRKTFQKANYQGAYSPDRRYDEYLEDVYYYVRAGTSPFEKVKLKEKTLSKALPAHENDIKSIARKNKLDLSTEAGVIALFRELERI